LRSLTRLWGGVSKAVASLLVLSCDSCGAYTFLRSKTRLQNGNLIQVQPRIENQVRDDLKVELRMGGIQSYLNVAQALFFTVANVPSAVNEPVGPSSKQR